MLFSKSIHILLKAQTEQDNAEPNSLVTWSFAGFRQKILSRCPTIQVYMGHRRFLAQGLSILKQKTIRHLTFRAHSPPIDEANCAWVTPKGGNLLLVVWPATCCLVHQEHLYTLLPTPPSPINSSPFLEYSSMVTSLGNLSSPLHPKLSEVSLFCAFGSPCTFPL